MIKKVLIALATIVVLLIVAVAIASFAAPTDFRVTREVTINKPRADIYNYVKLLRNQNEWGAWFKREPTMQQEFRGTDGTVGFVTHWKGTKKETGEGEQEIKQLVENERMDTELRFTEPMNAKVDASLTLAPVTETQTKVDWVLSGSVPRPLNVVLLAMDMDKEMGKDLAEGLATLKTIMEK